MSEEIGRDIGEIGKRVVELNKELSASRNETRKLDAALRMDSNNVELIRKKFAAMQADVQRNVEKVKLLKQQQVALRQAVANGEVTQSTYTSQMGKTNKQIETAERNIKNLNAALAQQNSVISSARLDAFANKLDRLKRSAQALSRAALGVVTAIAGASVAFIKTGDTLDDVSRKWQISAEKLQVQNNLFDKITEDSKGYESALNALGSIMSTIARGRGAAYLKVLREMGIAQEDLEGMNTAQLYDLVFEKLRGITDETQRAIVAQKLMGEAGLNVALVAGTAGDEIDRLNNELAQNGIISSEDAANAGKLMDTFADVKIRFMAVFGALVTALMPALLMLFDFITETLIPIIERIVEFLGNLDARGQKVLIFILLLIIFLPKIIGIVKSITTVIGFLKAATMGQAAATGALGAATTSLMPVLIIVAGIVLLLIAIFSIFSKKTRDAAGELDGFKKTADDFSKKYEGLSAELGMNVDSISHTTTTTREELEVNVNATGDTPIAQENADLLTDMFIDKLNKRLGVKA